VPGIRGAGAQGLAAAASSGKLVRSNDKKRMELIVP
jgi:hypothetical protein